VISGAGSLLNLSGALNVGTALGTGELTVGPGGSVHASVINVRGQVVLAGGALDHEVVLVRDDAGGSGSIGGGVVIDEGTIQANSAAPNGLLVVNGTVMGGGTLTIAGSTGLDGTTIGTPGVLLLDHIGTMELTGPVLNTSATFTDNATPAGTWSVVNSVVDVMFLQPNEMLKLDDIAGFAGTITAFQAGDALVVNGGTLSGLAVSNGDTLTAADSRAGGRGTDRFIFGSAVNADAFNIVNGDTVLGVACFAAGTLIETVHGPVAVDDLSVGDRVVTFERHAGIEAGLAAAEPDQMFAVNRRGGTEIAEQAIYTTRRRCQPIVWIGQRAVNCDLHPRAETVWPVRVGAGAFGGNVPLRDLYLSPDHAIYVAGVLVPVKLMIDGSSIVQVRRSAVTYYHLELPRHAVIRAEGLTVESYLDTGGRHAWLGGRVTALYPDFAAKIWETDGCAELVQAGPVLRTIREWRTRQANQRSRAPVSKQRTQRSPAAFIIKTQFVTD